MSKELFRQGTFENGQTYAVFGVAENGPAEIVDDAISIVGEDVAIVLPEYNVAGVFDGAGGTGDIGSPLEASLTASEAVGQYFKSQRRSTSSVEGAMSYAREAVVANKMAGLCVGALVQLKDDGSVDAVNAGDTGIVTYSYSRNALHSPVKQQISHGEPSNALGRHESRFKTREPDDVVNYFFDTPDTELYVMSDGALGSWFDGTVLEDYHFQAAHNEYLLLQTAIETRPNLEKELQAVLEQPKFSLSKMNWDNLVDVRPYLEKIIKKDEIKMDIRRYSSVLVSRLVAWDFERHHTDDATMVIINYPTFT